MVTPFLQFLLLLWFLASLSFPPSVAFAPEPSGPAERLIQALNLLPDDPSESHSQGVDSEGSQLVERRIHLDVRGKSGIDARDLGQYAGYFKLKDTHASRMFYMFFESRENKAKDPVVLWMSGGPGCSSELALFYENGPFQIANNLTLVWNDYGWDKASSIIFVDQPIGTGFSYTTDVRDMRHDENGVSQDVYNFLQAFFEVHPEFASNGFYVTGESYAGHYVPAVTSRIHQANKAKKGLPINLKGFAIGNGLTNPEIQYKAYADYALEMNLIDQASYNNLSNMYPSCQKAIRSCGTDGTISCATAYVTCQLIFSSLMSLVGEVNYYDIRKKCNGNLCYDFSKMENLLNTQLVKDALGVGDRKFVSCSTLVYKDMLVDWMRNLEVGIPTLLEDGIKLLVYAGDYDLICNWLGNSRWVSAIEWSGKESYASALSESFLVDGEEAGSFTNYGPLTFLKVHDAGHMVPMDQPKASLDMIRHFTKAIPFNDESLVNLI